MSEARKHMDCTKRTCLVGSSDCPHGDASILPIHNPSHPPVLVTVLLNEDMMAMLPTRGYQDGDELRVAWRTLGTYDLMTNFTLEADEFFRVLNIDHPANYRDRSLSVGDVVLFETPYGNTALAVCSLGFEPVMLPKHYLSVSR